MAFIFNPNKKRGLFMIPSGATKSPTPTPPSFTNTYSLSFDGVDDYVSYSNSWFAPSTPSQSTGNSVGSFSCWFKTTNFEVGGDLKGILSFNVGSNAKPLLWAMYRGNNIPGGRYLRFYFRGSDGAGGTTGLEQFFVYDNASTTYGGSGISFEDDTWYHLALVFDKDATNRVTVYVNGNQFLIPNTTTGSGSAGTRTISSIGLPYSLPYNPSSTGITPKCDIACVRNNPTNVTYNSPINLDELSLYDYALTSANVTSIYNSGVPNDVSSLNQIAWYRMGDNGSYKSPQWLIPENSNKDKVSNYSFEFDGVDDQIDLSDIAFLKGGGSSFSISCWVKTTSTSQVGYWSCRSANPDQMNLFRDTNRFCRFELKSSTGGDMLVRSDTVQIPDNTWTHISVTFDGTQSVATDKLKLYINGAYVSQVVTGSSTGLPQGSLTVRNYIGRTFLGVRQTGLIDELAIFDTTLTSANVSTIYNSGVPTTITGAVAHWKLGEEATFSTNWTVPDQVGSNNGTSANMTIEDRVGDAPNSISNAISFNMLETDRKEDTPPTP